MILSVVWVIGSGQSCSIVFVSSGLTGGCSERDMDKVPEANRRQRVADPRRYTT
jgi:hypothetical protein